MIVLAGAIILSLNNSGIINKSNEAVDLTNIANVREFAQTKWAEAYLETDKTQEELEEYVLAGLTEAGIKTEDYDIVVTTKGVEVNKAGDVKIITFSINQVEYQAEEGMTWMQWVVSSYNTVGFVCNTEEHYPTHYLSETQYEQISCYLDPVTGNDMLEEGVEVTGHNQVRGKHKISANVNYTVIIEDEF